MSTESALNAICIGVALSSMIVGGLALAMSCVAWSKVVGMENSTHQIQYVPIEDDKGEPIVGDKLDENMERAMSMEYTEREFL
jgi:hypothetical protein